jgi:hypothetical protein
MHECRYRINNSIASFVTKLGGHYIRYPDICQNPRQVPPGRLLADTNASFMIEEPNIHTLVSGFPTVIVLNLLDKTMKMKRKTKTTFA